MSFQFGICDDNREDIWVLSEALHSYDASLKFISYTDGESLLEDLLEYKVYFDILFLDIYMPGLNGVEIARKIRNNNKDTKIILPLTAMNIIRRLMMYSPLITF